MNKIKIDIKGMHCRSCEMLVEDELLKIPGVSCVKVNQKKGIAEISHKAPINLNDIAAAVHDAGYSVGKDTRAFFSTDKQNYKELGIAIIILFNIWGLLTVTGGFSVNTSGLTNFASIPVVFLIGLTAGISTCMALVGGLVLGSAARFAEKHPEATLVQKFKPHIFFNLGRIISFFILGAIIGYAGSFFRFSAGTLGFLIITVGIVMFFLGMQLIEISPKLSAMSFTLPKSISRLFGIKEHNSKEYTHKNAAILGGLTFFLPCGFTQAMQLYAMSTGSPVSGALTMGVFALGTTPGLLSVGGLTSVVKGVFARIFFKFAGVVVIALAFYNIASGFTLAGIKNISFPNLSEPSIASETNNADVQLINATYSVTNDMQPSTFTVKAGVPSRLEIDSQDNGAGCMGSIALPGLAQNVEIFRKGQKTVFNFTAQPGEYTIACAMGVPRGKIIAL